MPGHSRTHIGLPDQLLRAVNQAAHQLSLVEYRRLRAELAMEVRRWLADGMQADEVRQELLKRELQAMRR